MHMDIIGIAQARMLISSIFCNFKITTTTTTTTTGMMIWLTCFNYHWYFLIKCTLILISWLIKLYIPWINKWAAHERTVAFDDALLLDIFFRAMLIRSKRITSKEFVMYAFDTEYMRKTWTIKVKRMSLHLESNRYLVTFSGWLTLLHPTQFFSSG